MNPIDLRRHERSSVIRRSRALRAAVAVWLAILIWAFARVAAASEPEIIGLQVPAAKTSKYFPPGTELRVLSAEQFKSLANKAADGLKRQLSAEPARLIRARHHARWDGDILTGETELVIARASAGPADFQLDPWSPAVVSSTTAAAGGFPDGDFPANPFTASTRPASHTPAIASDTALSSLLGARDSGKQSIWVERYARQAVRLTWELQAQKRASGRSIFLALPGEATTVLSLELPKAWIPSVRLGSRRARSRRAALIASSGKSRPRRAGSSSSFSIPIKAIHRPARISGFRGRQGSTCAERSIARQAPSTGRMTGCSSSIRAIPNRSRSSLTRAWSW